MTYAAPKGSPWGADYFPNIELIDQDGKTVRFYDDLIKDKVVVINFIYTHCGDTCPAQTASLRQVYKLLADRMGKDIFFYSISIDPKHDTPKALKDYADSFKTGAGWRFLTGKKEDVTLLRKKLGLFIDGVEADKLSAHKTSFMIGNDNTGQWIKRSPFDEPQVLASLIGRSLSRAKDDKKTELANYSESQQLPKIGKGEDLFRSRCDSCHSLGDEDGVGPGLLNVTQQRDRTWLTRWIKTPDKLLAEKDPIAMALFKQYKKVLMPNFRLSDADVEALLMYMENSSKAAQPDNSKK
ncbi:MAG: SCO family protein [Methylococcaceae bacterium]|nr:SCO family protein [Methylococcaceae bacterium]